MILATFLKSLDYDTVPNDYSIHLKSLWYDAKNNWQEAHDLIDHLEDADSAYVHAYLHRKEGDLWNAKYWYNRAQKTMPKNSLEEEWLTLVQYFLPA